MDKYYQQTSEDRIRYSTGAVSVIAFQTGIHLARAVASVSQLVWPVRLFWDVGRRIRTERKQGKSMLMTGR